MLPQEMCVPIEKLNVPHLCRSVAKQSVALCSHHLTMRAFAPIILPHHDQRAFKVELGLFGGQLCSFQIDGSTELPEQKVQHDKVADDLPPTGPSFITGVCRFGFVEHLIGQQPLELGVLIFKRLHPGGFGNLHAPEFGFQPPGSELRGLSWRWLRTSVSAAVAKTSGKKVGMQTFAARSTNVSYRDASLEIGWLRTSSYRPKPAPTLYRWHCLKTCPAAARVGPASAVGRQNSRQCGLRPTRRFLRQARNRNRVSRSLPC